MGLGTALTGAKVCEHEDGMYVIIFMWIILIFYFRQMFISNFNKTF